MAKYLICLILQRLLLPVLIAICFLRRPVGISIPYFLLFLYLPLVPVATSKSMKGRTGVFLKLLIASTIIISLCQIAFQIAIVSLESDFLPKCGFLEIILRHVGLVKLIDLPVLEIIDWISPEILMLITSLGIFFALRNLSMHRVHDIENDGETLLHTQTAHPVWTEEKHKFFSGLGVFLSMFSILVAASLRPSIEGGVYFLIYIACGTYWACYRSLSKGFGFILRILMVFIILHLATLLSYQTPILQEMFNPNSTIPRYFGLSDIYHSSCEGGEDNRYVYLNKTLEIDSYLNPIAILICYYILAFTSSLLLTKVQDEIKKSGAFGNLENSSRLSRQVSTHLKRRAADKWRLSAKKLKLRSNVLATSNEPNERTPLMRKGTRRLKDSNAEETASGEMQMSPLELKDKEVPSTEGKQDTNFVDQLILGIETIATIIYKNSYIFTNICMMAWSIMYHSWLTFVFLIWANILWVIPNQRKAMLQSSPLIVLYAIFLLFAQYAYSMNLTEDELPTHIKNDNINLAQIGFQRYAHYPIQHILIKSAFTVMFWITLRQLIQENVLKKQKSTIADMVAPLQVTVGTAAGRIAGAKPEKSAFMKNMGDLFNSLLLKTWIWIVMLTVFTSGIAGNKMTGFRIIYMALFLIFILMFQISWRVWKSFMYGFWLILIAYAMLILILVYTYQFDRFPEYWTKYLGISDRLQKDIGLDVFATKELFLNLLTPTLVVIITVIQLHYFHHKYIKMLQLPIRNNSVISATTTNNSTNFGNMPANTDEIHSENTYENQANSEKRHSFLHAFKLRKMTFSQFKEHLTDFGKFVMEFAEFLWIFLELHLIKLILFIAFLLGIYDVSLLHISFVVLSVIGAAIQSNLQILISRVISFVVAILFITKMIYQVDYINHENYDVVCNNVTNPNGINNADWFGLERDQFGLVNLLKGYIYYLIVVTIHSVVRFRQHHKRASHNEPYATPAIIFPKINRINSEKNLSNMIKYLMNYGFYKFGIEISLIMLVALIGSRLDLVACIYTIWLVIVFSINRQNAAKIWFIFVLFIIVCTIVQYIIIVGLPPGLCVEYPWKTEFLQKLQKWAMLPDAQLYTQVKKLVLDFILLLVVTRQAVVFRIERRYKDPNKDFPGGNNTDITSEITRQGFSLIENSTPDFTTHVRNWLDIMKRILLPSLFWFSLAIVFLTGANRVNLFSIGYLISSFIFLWQGSDLYLRPINTIIKWWRVMLTYNIFVIIFKTFLQIAGCLFFDYIAKYACWIIQLLGITCITKFEKKVLNAHCGVPDEEVGLFWDGVCFACLLFQLRTFRSYYFCHIVNDTKASNILASRGAQLIEEFQAKQLRLQGEHENEILEKIKMKMDRIKATQQKLKIIRDPKIHAEDDGIGGTSAPLARSTSMSSCAGYHTPIEDEVVTSIIVENGGGSDVPSYIEPLTTSRGYGGGVSAGGGSYLQTQALSPSSAIMTVSLDGYLEPQRLSFGSPPGSDLLPRIPSLDDTFPVFSPPPFNDQIQKSPKQVKQNSMDQQDSNTTESTTQSITLVPSVLEDNAVQTNNLQIQRHRRQSSLNAVSWPDQNITDGTQRRRYSSTLNPTYASADEQSPVYRPRIHQRHSSISASIRDSRRRSSYTFNANDEPSASIRTGYQRQSSWGPVGDMYHRQSIVSTSSRSPNSHHESIRSGDYYMFEELDNKVDLDILTEKVDDDTVEDATSQRLKNKLTVGQLISLKMQEMNEAELKKNNKAKDMNRRASYHPTSEKIVDARTTISEPIMRDSEPSAPHYEAGSVTDDQQPSTSRGLPTTPKMQRKDSKSTIGSIEDTPTDKDEKQSPLKGLLFIWTFIESILVSLTIRLNRVSRNYRYVMKVLSKEKKTLKSSEGFGMGLKISSALIWGQAPASEQTATEQVDTAATSTISSGSITLEVVDSPKKSSGENDRTSKDFSDKGFPTQVVKTPDTHDERRTSMVPEIRILAPSLERGLDDASLYKKNAYDIFMDSEEKLKDSEDFSRKEHSVIVELFASIWFAILSHTDFLCYLMVLLNQVQSASILSLPLPLMVFFWGTLTVPRPSKTFWITLIAYTQTVVLLKCVSQFEILWWNEHPIPENQPLAPARIFGIEKKKGYATYDLALLLVVFFHRFMLKSMGLWKSELRDEVLNDGIYKIKSKSGQIGDDKNGVVVKLDDNSEDIIERLIDKGMTVQEALTKNKEYIRILRKDRRLVTLQELIFILNLELQGVIVNGSFKQIVENGNIVNVVKSNKKEIQLTKVDSTDRIDFVNESGDSDKVQVSNLIEETSNYFPEIVKLASNKYTSSIRNFFETLLGPASRATRDVYVYMILCDFINFLVLLFGFTSFGSSQGDGGVTSYLQENKIPVAFLVMLILQFVLIVIDRALYLRKYLLGKIIFQYILIVAIHIWMFFVLPGVTERSFNMKLAPVIWYFIKCIYLLFSAYQIRCGYPKRSLGNFLTKGFGIINFISHKVFLLIPFLFELRTLMDWIWTDTTMTLFDWLKMEDIFVSVYQIKCSRQLETDFPKPRGIKTPILVKYLMGGGLLFVLIAIIWFPLALFAFGNTVGESNPPYDVTVSLRIGPYEPVYTMSAQDSNIIPFSDAAYNQMMKQFSRDRVALTFLSNFDPRDITAITLSANSTSLWNISPPDKNRLREDVESNHTLTVRFKYSVSRHLNSEKEKNSETLTEDRKFELGIGDPRRQILSNMLSGTPDDELLIMPHLYPKFLKVKNQGALRPTARLLGPDYYENDDNAFRSISLTLHSDMNGTPNPMWWEIREICNGTGYDNILANLPYNDCEESVVMYLFNDKIFPSQLSSIAANGIVGLYLSLVIVVSRVIRGFFSLMYTKIMFEDLPYIDRVLQLCLDIYLVREALEFQLEEDLFAKLIFLYRSPETMIKWTRPKEEESDDDDDEDGIPPPPAERRLTDTDYTVRQRKPLEEKIQ